MKTIMILGLLVMVSGCTVTRKDLNNQHQQQNKAGKKECWHGIAPPGPDAHPFQKEMYRDMSKMMIDMHAQGYTGNWDVDFLAMMIPHHQGAIDMARLLLIHGKDPLTRRLAQEIIASQQAEIEAMKARLAILREKGQDPNPGGYPAINGTRGIIKQNE